MVVVSHLTFVAVSPRRRVSVALARTLRRRPGAGQHDAAADRHRQKGEVIATVTADDRPAGGHAER